MRNACAFLTTICALLLGPQIVSAGDEGAVADATNAYQWQPVELTFIAQQEYEQPFDYKAVRLSGLFEGPDGERLEIAGFYDGGRTWKIRFTPPSPGPWRYTTTFSDPTDTALQGRRGAIDVQPAKGDNPLFLHGGFLKVSANQRYLTYTDGTPFFWLGDTWWFCPSTLVPFDGSSQPDCPSMFRKLVDVRAGQRFTVGQMCFLGPPQIAPGFEDFVLLKPESWKPEHASYWQTVDRYVRYANAHGIMPVVGMTFHRSADPVPLDAFKQLWAYFIARYGAMPVGVLMQGEYNLEQGPFEERVEKVLALGRFLKEIDPYKRALTVHPWYFGRDGRQTWDEPWYDFIMIQGGHGQKGPSPKFYLDVYRRSPPKPLLEAECTYDGIHGYGAEIVRHNAFKAIQSGSFGYTYGSHGLWYPNQNADDQKFDNWGKPIPWWEALERPGGVQMQHLRACYELVPWWKLEPRPEVVQPACDVLAKAAGDDAFLLYFVAEGKVPATAGLVGMQAGSEYKAVWFDPRSGKTRALAETLKAGADGLALPRRPDGQDWVLVLERVDRS